MKTDLLRGIVTKGVGGVFSVLCDDKKYTCFSPKKLRYNDFDVVVGDTVLFEDLHRGKGNIVEILPRKNKLTRPEVANVDVCLLVLACQPQPDLYLADKVLINCFQQGIEPVIVVNKMDIDDGTALEIRKNYNTICDIVSVSAFDTQSVEVLRRFIEGKVVCFTGQSAVGKTSILNALLPEFNGKTGGLSEKTGRGMHTTRHSSLHKVLGGFIADTCGFSLLTLQNIRSEELRLYLDDFVKISSGFRYHSCTHTVEPNCAVKKAVAEGNLCKERYDRYIEEYAELVEEEKRKY